MSTRDYLNKIALWHLHTRKERETQETCISVHLSQPPAPTPHLAYHRTTTAVLGGKETFTMFLKNSQSKCSADFIEIDQRTPQREILRTWIFLQVFPPSLVSLLPSLPFFPEASNPFSGLESVCLRVPLSSIHRGKRFNSSFQNYLLFSQGQSSENVPHFRH